MRAWTYEHGGRRIAVTDWTWADACAEAHRVLADDDRATGRGLQHCGRAVSAAAAVIDRRRQAVVRGAGMDPYLAGGTMTGDAVIPRGSMLDGSSDEDVSGVLSDTLGSLPDCTGPAVRAAERECGGWR